MKLPLPGLWTAIALVGCSTSTDGGQPPPPASTVIVEPTAPTSTLIVRWTINGVPDPNACVATGSTTFEVSIADPNDVEIGAFQQSCVAFATSIALAPGTYSAFGVLLDDGGGTRTTDAPIAPFALFANDELTVTVDFPSSSFR